MGKPVEKVGTVWVANAQIQRINVRTERWDTLATCLDTPAAIRAAIADNRLAGSLWVRHALGDREYLGEYR